MCEPVTPGCNWSETYFSLFYSQQKRIIMTSSIEKRFIAVVVLMPAADRRAIDATFHGCSVKMGEC